MNLTNQPLITKAVLRKAKATGDTVTIAATIFSPERMKEPPGDYMCRFQIGTMFDGVRVIYGVDEFQAVILAIQIIDAMLSKQYQDFVILEENGGEYRCHSG